VLTASLVAILLAAVVIAYLAGGISDKGRFRAEPPACATIQPSLPLLGFAYTTQQTESNSCHLLLPPGHPRHSSNPDIIVSYFVATPSWGDAPKAASRELTRTGAGALPPLPGLGDEAYLWNRGVVMRVSNLVVGVVVFPLHESTEDRIRAFAADVARRLRDG
jgi:hypothetical protein